MIEITIQTFKDSEIIAAIQAIRYQVFEIEQNVDHELEFDGLDETAQHLLAYWDQTPVGTARIRYLSPHQAKIERLAVLPEFRRHGIGTKLMQTALTTLENSGVNETLIHAQEYIQDLYQKLGFQPLGKPFDEAGISHIKMVHLSSTSQTVKSQVLFRS